VLIAIMRVLQRKIVFWSGSAEQHGAE